MTGQRLKRGLDQGGPEWRAAYERPLRLTRWLMVAGLWNATEGAKLEGLLDWEECDRASWDRDWADKLNDVNAWKQSQQSVNMLTAA